MLNSLPTPTNPPSSKKYLPHFQSINTPPAPSPVPPSSHRNYTSTLELYGSSISIIDKIADSPVKHSKVSWDADRNSFVEKPMIVGVGAKVREKLMAINNFF